MRRMTTVLLVLFLGVNAVLGFQLNQKHWDLVRKEQGFLLMSLTELASHTYEMRSGRQPSSDVAPRLAANMSHVLSSRDQDVTNFYRVFFDAWSKAVAHALSTDSAHQIVDISRVMYEILAPLSGSSTEAGALNQKNKRLAALSLVKQLREKNLWSGLTAYRPELDRLLLSR